MADRYGPLYAGFTPWDDPSTVISSGGVFSLQGILEAEVTKKKGMMNRGRFVMAYQEDWETFVQAGRIVFLYQGDGVLDDIREMGSFLIEKATPTLEQSGRQTITVTGLGREKLLTKYRVWEPVGEESIHATTLTAGVPAPWMVTVAGGGAPPGNDSVTLSSDAGLEVGDEIRIQLDNDDWFVGRITGVDLPLAAENQVQYEPRIPGTASSGNAVELRKCWLSVDSAETVAVNQRVELVMNSGTHVARVEGLADGRIQMSSGATGAADSGKAVQVYSYSEPATDDVTQIVSHATGWSVWFQMGGQGTANGTAHVPKGDSVWDVLQATAERTGEFWRVAPLVGGRPVKRIDWYQTADYSEMTLILYTGVSQTALHSATDDPDIGIVYRIAEDKEFNVITRVYASAADGRISLASCSAGALAAAASAGYSVVVSEDLYEPDYVQYGPGHSEHGVLSDQVRYGNVELPPKAVGAEIQAASDALLEQAMATLRQAQERRYYRVKAHMHRPLWPGQTVTVTNPAMEPIVNETLHVLEVREVLEKGLIMSYLVLSSEPEERSTTVRSLGKVIKGVQQAARRSSSGGSADRIGGVAGGGGGGDHGSLTGLTDDDHGQYLRTDGARTLMGSMAVTAGATIDGVDISAHAANPSAHHAPVSAADASIAVDGQAIRLADAAAGFGLGLTSGVLAVKTATALGTRISDDSVGVQTKPGGGLETEALGLRILRPANSGVALNETGTFLRPAAVGANTSTLLDGEYHTHVVLAYSDTKANPGEVMKASAEGDHVLRYLTADKVTVPLVESGGALTIDPGGQLVYLDGDLTLQGGSRWLRTVTGDLTLAPAGELSIAPVSGVMEVQPSVTLKTAHWASGFLGTGWGLSYDGHLDTRSIYADELHVAAFIADTARVKVGSEYITQSMALLAEDFTVPPVGASATLVVEDVPGLADLPVFDNNNWVLLRVMNRAGGGLLVANVWGQVTNYADGPAAGQQRWTFTCRSTTAAGQIAAGGSVALDFGKSGAGWWWVTAIDPAGAPYAGISMWQGSNPYTPANRYHVLRLGQLKGVTGVNELGLHAGLTTSRRIRFSELSFESHGVRQSLYAGDGAQLRLGAVEVQLYRDVVNYSTLLPNADHTAVNVVKSSSLYYQAIDEGVAGGSMSDYVANGPNTNGVLFVGLSEPSPWGAVYGARVRARVQGVGFSDDRVTLYAQVFAADEVTPLTDEVAVYVMTGNTSVMVDRNFGDEDTAATQAQWNGARLRLRWEYVISASEETIRLDPQVPSLAVGRALPTGFAAGGDGFWVGDDAGTYKLRIGEADGLGMRWTGTALVFYNADNAPVISLASDGSSQLAGPMTIGVSGGIWQGTGSFASPTTGLKLHNTAGIGRLSTFNGGLEQLTINTNGQLVAGNGSVILDRSGLRLNATSQFDSPGRIRYHDSNGNLIAWLSASNEFFRLEAAQSVATYTNMQLARNGGALFQVTRSGQGTAVYSLEHDRMISSADVYAMQSVRIGTGLVVGSMDVAAPAAGVIRLRERTSAVGTPPPGTADLYILQRNGRQELYIKFDDGSGFTVQQSIA